MKKAIAIAAVLAFLAAGSVFATETRVQGLGVQSWMIPDDSVVTLLPSQVNDYSNLSVLETGSGSTSIMINTFIGKSVLSLISSSPLNPQMYNDYTSHPLYSGSFPINSVTLPDAVTNIESAYNSGWAGVWNSQANLVNIINQTGAIYGFGAGDMKTALGLLVGNNASSNKYLTGIPPYQYAHSMTQVNLLGGVTLAGKMPIDIGLNIGMPFGGSSWQQNNNTNTIIQYKDASVIDFASSADLFARVGMDSWTFGAGAGYSNANTKVRKQSDAALTGHFTADNQAAVNFGSLSAKLGAADSLKMNDAFTVIAGAEAMFESSGSKVINKNNLTSVKTTYENGYVDLDIPLYAAAEIKLNDIVTARAGLNQSIWNVHTYSEKITNNAGQVTTNGNESQTLNPQTNINIGITANIGGFKLDLLMDKDLIYSGPYFINGSGSDLSTKFAVSYEWK